MKIFINGNATEAQRNTRDSLDCSLGHWLQSKDGELYNPLPAFQRFREAHDEFHYFVEMIIARVNAGETKVADSLLRNEFSQSTRRVVIAISELHEESLNNQL